MRCAASLQRARQPHRRDRFACSSTDPWGERLRAARDLQVAAGHVGPIPRTPRLNDTAPGPEGYG